MTTSAATPLNLFQRAERRLPLTPEERSALKFVAFALMTAVFTGGVTAAQYLGTSGKAINWTIVVTVFLTSTGATLYATAHKWVTAHADGPLGVGLQLLTEAARRTSVEKQLQVIQDVAGDVAAAQTQVAKETTKDSVKEPTKESVKEAVK